MHFTVLAALVALLLPLETASGGFRLMPETTHLRAARSGGQAGQAAALGRLREDSVQSAALGKEMKYRVLVPEGSNESLGDLRKQLHAQEIEQARQEVLDAIGDVLDLPDLLTLEQLLKEVGDLRRERDRYENERDTVLKEVFGALGLTSRAYTDGSIESLLVELDKMTGERDGYKHAFERAASEVEGILREASSLYDRVSGLDTELERFDVE